MANYPEWLLPYKTKGVYVSKKKNGYALYRGHSERVPGKKNPVFRCDEYLGIVTEKDGLIPSRPPVRSGIEVRRYGLWVVAEKFCSHLRLDPKSKGLDHKLLYARALLSLEGRDNRDGYAGSWLSVAWPGVDMTHEMSEEESKALKRIQVQMKSLLAMRLGDDKERVMELSRDVYAVHVNGGWHIGDVPPELEVLASKYGLDFFIDEVKRGKKRGRREQVSE